jgi:hypothetical protein
MKKSICLGSHRHSLRFLASLCVLTGPCCGASFALSSAPVWKPSVNLLFGAASYDNQQGDRFLAFDHYGVPSVVSATDQGAVNFSRQLDGINWLNRSLSSVNAKHASIAFDRHELPAIAFGDDEGLKYTYFSPATLDFETNLIDDASVTGRSWSAGTGIAFDIYGRPAVAAAIGTGTSTDLYYVSDSNQDGVLSAADGVEFVSPAPEHFPSLAFDRQNRPIVANRYLGGPTSGDLDIWMKDPFLGWQLRIISNAEPGSPDAVTGSMAIDPTDGLPAAAWTNRTVTSSQLWYGKWNPLENAWDTTLVASNPTNQLGSESLAFDPADGRPAISYGDNAGKVNFAWFNGANWVTQVADTTGTSFAPRTSLAFNEYGHGFPAIAYITNSGDGTGNLEFVVDPPSTVPEPAAIVLVLASMCSLAPARRRRFT